MIASSPEWYQTVYAIAFGVARRAFRFTSADAEDVAQEMALRALRQMRVAEINRAWIHRGATYLCIDLTRARDLEQRTLQQFVVDPTARRIREIDLDLALAISQLSPHCQRLIHHYFREGRTWAEIDSLLDRGRRCSQYATSKCLGELQRILAGARESKEPS